MTTSPTVLRLASRLEQVGFSDIVKLRNQIMKLRAEGATVYQFEGGEPFMPTPEPIKEAMKRALDEDQTRYAPSSGIPELREGIAEKLRLRNRIGVAPIAETEATDAEGFRADTRNLLIDITIESLNQ